MTKIERLMQIRNEINEQISAEKHREIATDMAKIEYSAARSYGLKWRIAYRNGSGKGMKWRTVFAADNKLELIRELPKIIADLQALDNLVREQAEFDADKPFSDELQRLYEGAKE